MKTIIKSIRKPTKTSEARKRQLQLKQTHRTLTTSEQNELLSLEMRQFWNIEC